MIAELPANAPAQAGFTVSSRKFPRAVDRNRIKRLGRECWRLHKSPLLQLLQEKQLQLAVFFIYTDKKIPEFTPLRHKFSLILNRLEKEILKMSVEPGSSEI